MPLYARDDTEEVEVPAELTAPDEPLSAVIRSLTLHEIADVKNEQMAQSARELKRLSDSGVTVDEMLKDAEGGNAAAIEAAAAERQRSLEEGDADELPAGIRVETLLRYGLVSWSLDVKPNIKVYEKLHPAVANHLGLAIWNKNREAFRAGGDR